MHRVVAPTIPLLIRRTAVTPPTLLRRHRICLLHRRYLHHHRRRLSNRIIPILQFLIILTPPAAITLLPNPNFLQDSILRDNRASEVRGRVLRWSTRLMIIIEGMLVTPPVLELGTDWRKGWEDWDWTNALSPRKIRATWFRLQGMIIDTATIEKKKKGAHCRFAIRF